jgi:hypothetical protein
VVGKRAVAKLGWGYLELLDDDLASQLYTRVVHIAAQHKGVDRQDIPKYRERMNRYLRFHHKGLLVEAQAPSYFWEGGKKALTKWQSIQMYHNGVPTFSDSFAWGGFRQAKPKSPEGESIMTIEGGRMLTEFDIHVFINLYPNKSEKKNKFYIFDSLTSKFNVFRSLWMMLERWR